jgi:hypothetical protein
LDEAQYQYIGGPNLVIKVGQAGVSNSIVHETQEIHRRPALPNMGNHLAGGYFQGGQQRLSAVTNIFIRPSAWFLGAQR